MIPEGQGGVGKVQQGTLISGSPHDTIGLALGTNAQEEELEPDVLVNYITATLLGSLTFSS